MNSKQKDFNMTVVAQANTPTSMPVSTIKKIGKEQPKQKVKSMVVNRGPHNK